MSIRERIFGAGDISYIGMLRDAHAGSLVTAHQIASLDPGEQKDLARAIYRAKARVIRWDRARRWVSNSIAILCLATAPIVTVLVSHAFGNWPKTFPADSPASAFLGYFLGILTLGIFARTTARRRWRSTPPTIKAPAPIVNRISDATRSGTQAYVFLIFASALLWIADTPQMFSRYLIAGIATGFFEIFVLSSLSAVFCLPLLARRYYGRPLDRAIHGLTVVIRDARNLSRVWHRSDVARFLINSLERVASFVESSRVRTYAPLTEPLIRKSSTQTYERIAYVIRLHKNILAQSRDRQQYERVIESLESGLIAMAFDNWDDLLENAPESTRVQRLVSGWLVRNFLPALLLGFGAIALPLLPPFHGSSNSVLGLRITLGVYAVIRLLPGQQNLTGLFDNGLSRGFSRPGATK